MLSVTTSTLTAPQCLVIRKPSSDEGTVAGSLALSLLEGLLQHLSASRGGPTPPGDQQLGGFVLLGRLSRSRREETQVHTGKILKA